MTLNPKHGQLIIKVDDPKKLGRLAGFYSILVSGNRKFLPSATQRLQAFEANIDFLGASALRLCANKQISVTDISVTVDSADKATLHCKVLEKEYQWTVNDNGWICPQVINLLKAFINQQGHGRIIQDNSDDQYTFIYLPGELSAFVDSQNEIAD